MDISETIRSATRRNHSMLLRGLRDVSQKRVAALVGISETTMSEMKSEHHLERCCAVIAACGLKLARCTDQVFTDEYVGALRTLAAVGLGHESASPSTPDSELGDL